MELADLGYSPFFEAARGGASSGCLARVTAEYKEAYRVKTTGGEYLAKVMGKTMFDSQGREDYPAVGDWVEMEDMGAERAIIRRILPRRTLLARKKSGADRIQLIAANIDTAFIIEAANRDYNLNRIERYIALARNGGIEPVIILNKTDLLTPAELSEMSSAIAARCPGVPFVAASTVTPGGLAELKRHILAGRTYCFLGSSGVGKSTLINHLAGEDLISTREIGTKTDRGRHTTTGREMHFLPGGGILVDNPGMREVGMADSETGILDTYGVITALAEQCRYADCTHTGEPDCAVTAAVRDGRLDRAQYENYLTLKKEADHFGSTAEDRKKKDRRLGMLIQQFKRKGYKDF